MVTISVDIHIVLYYLLFHIEDRKLDIRSSIQITLTITYAKAILFWEKWQCIN